MSVFPESLRQKLHEALPNAVIEERPGVMDPHEVFLDARIDGNLVLRAAYPYLDCPWELLATFGRFSRIRTVAKGTLEDVIRGIDLWVAGQVMEA